MSHDRLHQPEQSHSIPEETVCTVWYCIHHSVNSRRTHSNFKALVCYCNACIYNYVTNCTHLDLVESDVEGCINPNIVGQGLSHCNYSGF